MQDQVKLSLSTLCNGELEAQFQHLVPAIMSQLEHGQKGGVAIAIELKRVPDTDTMVTVGFSITPKFPANKKASICQVTGDNELKTDAPPEKPKVVSMFEAQ